MEEILFTVKCIKTHEDCVTNGETYNVVAESEDGYEVYPDKYGHLSNVHKSYFNPITMPQDKQIKQFVQEWMDSHEPDTFIKNEHGKVIYSAGPSSLNLTAFFENLLEDYKESLITN